MNLGTSLSFVRSHIESSSCKNILSYAYLHSVCRICKFLSGSNNLIANIASTTRIFTVWVILKTFEATILAVLSINIWNWPLWSNNDTLKCGIVSKWIKYSWKSIKRAHKRYSLPNHILKSWETYTKNLILRGRERESIWKFYTCFDFVWVLNFFKWGYS